MMSSDKGTDSLAYATVMEALPNALFRVELDNGGKQIVYLSGKMRLHRIRVLVGDRVKILLDRYGGKGRIVERC